MKIIGEEFIAIEPALEGYIKALELRSKGFRDLIDLLLYLTSPTQSLLFLTRDNTLISFLREWGGDIGLIIYEEDFVKKYSNSSITA